MPDPSLPTDDAPQAEQTLPARVAQLLEEREALVPALAAFAAELPAGRYRHDLRSLVAKLERGTTADQLCESPGAMSTLLPLLSTGGQTAEAGDRLHELFTESAREEDLRGQRRRLLAYPLVVSLLAVVVVVFLSVMVVPVYTDIFQSFDLQLPQFTVVVVQLSDWIRFQPMIVALVLLAGGVVFFVVWRLATASGWFEWMFGYLAIGNSRELAAMASFTRRLAEGLAAKLPLPVALKLAGQTSEHPTIKCAAQHLATDVATGGADSLRQSPAARRFPATLIYVLQMLSQSGSTSALITVRFLEELAETYSQRVHDRVDWSSGILSQFSILVVGVLVGAVMLAVLLPLVSLVEVLS